jgi:hypothetical protein
MERDLPEHLTRIQSRLGEGRRRLVDKIASETWNAAKASLLKKSLLPAEGDP